MKRVDNPYVYIYNMHMEKFIKDFAKSLTSIKILQYEKCYIIEIKINFKLKITTKCIKTCASVCKDTNRVLELKSSRYAEENKTIAEMNVVLLKKELNLSDSHIRKKDELTKKQYWRSFSRKEILEFSKETNDKNIIHLTGKPVVQGFMILMCICNENIKCADLKFINKIYCDEKIYISKQDNKLFGYVNDVLCFKCIINMDK